MSLQEAIIAAYRGPPAYAMADWRLRINDLYASIRAADEPARAWRIWHRRRSELFRTHPMSPVAVAQRAGFGSIPVFRYDPDHRFAVDLVPTDGPPLDYDLGPDGTMLATGIATTRGLRSRLGAELTVYWITGYGGGLFIPFRDATSGRETFGGGRYLVDAIKGADLGLAKNGRLILDFNFAYNPSCALNHAFVCPLSPAENTLPVAVRAGERVPDLQPGEKEKPNEL